jgi:diaminopimelate epimerase
MRKEIRYVLLDPTGNLTCLVLDPAEAREREAVTAALMDRCEQVGYLMPATSGEARARLQMMGGEFCGNASMATAAWLAREAGENEAEMRLEVSGVPAPVGCRVRREEDGSWSGTVEMPPVGEIGPFRTGGRELTAARMPGMTHLICEENLGRDEAEALLRSAAEEIPDPAVGLLQWDEEKRTMTPLVLVREAGTLVWETACGSGSTAVGAWRARRAGRDLETEVRQPGGTLRVRTAGEKIYLTGKVIIGETAWISLPAEGE